MNALILPSHTGPQTHVYGQGQLDGERSLDTVEMCYTGLPFQIVGTLLVFA